MEGVTRESLKPLLDLQRVDTSLDRLRERKADLPEQRELDELTERRDAAAAVLAERQIVLDGEVRAQNKLEAEIAQLRAKVEHERGRLYSGDVTSPKELSNIQAETDALQRRITHLEDDELEVMERREELEQEVAQLTKAQDELDTSVADATARRDAATVQVDAEIAALEAERSGLVAQVDDEVLELYEELRGKKGGVAVGALEDWTCRACSLPLSPMAKDEIRTSEDPLIRCENCRRLLVFP